MSNQEVTFGSFVKCGGKTDITPWIFIGITSLCVLLLSFFSGFKSFPVPFDLAWQFSPIGLLHGVSAENLDLDSQGFFSAHFSYSLDYFFVFFKTCLFEAPFYYYCFRKHSFSEFLSYLLFANFLTHPLVFFFIPTLFSKYITAALVSEAFAALVEMTFVATVLWRHESKKTVLVAAAFILLANLFSWEVGMFV